MRVATHKIIFTHRHTFVPLGSRDDPGGGTVKKLLSAMSLLGLQIGAYGSVVATCLLRAIGLCEWLNERF